jgi:hypothetical protein
MGIHNHKEYKPMALKTVLETTDGLDESLIPLYIETDGKFVLQIEGVDAHPDVANLKSAYERVKADRDTVKAERDQFKTKAASLPEDFDPEKWSKFKDGKPDEAALVSLRQELEADRDSWKLKAEKANEAARKNALDRDLTDALNDAGVINPSFAKAARNMLASDVQMSDEGKPFIDTDMGPLGLAEHVKRWAAGEGKDFVTAPKGGGGKSGEGSGTAGDSNPWKTETRNLTRQAEIMKTEPALAAQLKAAAGK